jgi:hypothetical protein
LVAQLQAVPTEHRALVLLDGVVMDMDAFVLGAVELRKMTGGQIDAFVDQVNGPFDAESDEARSGYIDGLRKQLVSELKDRVCIDCRVVADTGRAQELAEIEAARVVDLLRYAVPALYARGQRVTVALSGDVQRGERPVFAISTSSGAYEMRNVRVGALGEFRITSETIEVLRTVGVFAMADALTSEQRTPLENALLRAIHRFADAQAQRKRPTRLTSLITSLEALFTGERGAPIRLTLAEGVRWSQWKDSPYAKG